MDLKYFIGVDVGTRSVRAGLFTNKGKLINYESLPITVHNPSADFYEQDSEEIWNAVCFTVKVIFYLLYLIFLNFSLNC